MNTLLKIEKESTERDVKCNWNLKCWFIHYTENNMKERSINLGAFNKIYQYTCIRSIGRSVFAIPCKSFYQCLETERSQPGGGLYSNRAGESRSRREETTSPNKYVSPSQSLYIPPRFIHNQSSERENITWQRCISLYENAQKRTNWPAHFIPSSSQRRRIRFFSVRKREQKGYDFSFFFPLLLLFDFGLKKHFVVWR